VAQVANPYHMREEGAPVAVLMGPGTGSSGEVTALSFVGRPFTRHFGQPTAGYTKGNEDFMLPDGSRFFIASVVSTDRTGKAYPDRIFPDEEIAPGTSGTDPVLERAKQWLITMSKCR
jgi:carboxyl-terminal processing protease